MFSPAQASFDRLKKRVIGLTVPRLRRLASAVIEEICVPAAETTTPTLRKTALNAAHRRMGAKMVEFNGWDMPDGIASSSALNF